MLQPKAEAGASPGKEWVKTALERERLRHMFIPESIPLLLCVYINCSITLYSTATLRLPLRKHR